MSDRALVFHGKDIRAGVHVLLIGSAIPWAEGGAKCTRSAQRIAAMGIGQLGGPPMSMRAMANGFCDVSPNPDRPLARLSLLLSEPAVASYRGQKVPRGTIADVPPLHS
ncbi:hypothetical protein [Muricoccus pecuniae]|uniref:Uncharacterized protein n=1 Tax=Muricoccus pecuniae TaxID=693023 RepID=A0A840YMN5_9PROT|nr:hypothetical protein [Roseomonas pecuniae]MBB5695974.1 hypothetical protein [Roseomonas pecuniae]